MTVDFLKQLLARWSDWCGDRYMETEIRKHLTTEGYFGGSAKLSNVRLVAVARPGWVQVYRFDAVARVAYEPQEDVPDPIPIDHTLYGLVREDARVGTQVRVFQESDERRSMFRTWSDGLICLRGSQGLFP